MTRTHRLGGRLADRETGTLTRRSSLASLVAVAFAAFALASAPNASAQEQLAASCEPPGEGGVPGALPGEVLAQTFTSALTGSLTRAQIEVIKAGGAGTGDFVVELRTVDDATGTPTDVILASATVPDADVPLGQSLLTVVFANPPAVVAGEQYAIAVSRPGAGEGAFDVTRREDCPGQGWRSLDGGEHWFEGGFDFPFRVFVTTTPNASQLTCKGEQATHVGTPDADRIGGTDGPDVIVALGGNDKVFAGDGDDLVCGNRGRDQLDGQGGEDKLFGARGKDRLFGGANTDLLVGGAKSDSLFGGDGKDKLRGGSPDAPGKDAQDLCRGGAANDKLKNCER